MAEYFTGASHMARLKVKNIVSAILNKRRLLLVFATLDGATLCGTMGRFSGCKFFNAARWVVFGRYKFTLRFSVKKTLTAPHIYVKNLKSAKFLRNHYGRN